MSPSAMLVLLLALSVYSAALPVTTTFFQATIRTKRVPVFAAFSSAPNLALLVFEHGLAVAEKVRVFLGGAPSPCSLLRQDYEYLAPLAASGAFAIISSGAHDSTLSEDSKELAGSMQDALAWVVGQAKSNSSFPLYQRLSGKVMAGGHSMGGGAAYISVQQQPSTFLATLTFAPCGYPNEVFPALAHVRVPSLAFAASRDCICHSIPLDEYRGLNSSCKWLVDVTNASHCGFCHFTVGRDKVVCEAAERAECPLTSHMPSALQQNITLTVSSLWLDYVASGQSSTALTALTKALVHFQSQSLLSWKTNCANTTGSH
jgi:hypothetical protein